MNQDPLQSDAFELRDEVLYKKKKKKSWLKSKLEFGKSHTYRSTLTAIDLD